MKRIAVDLAKSVFQLHAVDADGAVIWRKKVRRGALLDTLAQVPACLIGMEACATAHHWARELMRLGHEVRLIPPAYVIEHQSRSTKTLSRHAPLPSMLILISRAASTLMKSVDVNWLP